MDTGKRDRTFPVCPFRLIFTSSTVHYLQCGKPPPVSQGQSIDCRTQQGFARCLLRYELNVIDEYFLLADLLKPDSEVFDAPKNIVCGLVEFNCKRHDFKDFKHRVEYLIPILIPLVLVEVTELVAVGSLKPDFLRLTVELNFDIVRPQLLILIFRYVRFARYV